MEEENKTQNEVTPATEAPKEEVQPVPEAKVEAPVEATPVSTPTAETAPVSDVATMEATQETATPAVEATPASTPVVESIPEPVPTTAPVTPEPTPVEVTPTVQPVQEVTPTVQPTVNTLDGTTVVESSQNSGIQTSDQLGTMNNLGDVSSVGFVPTGEVIKKKPKKGVTLTIVLLGLVILGLVGYFFVYPFIVKTYLSNPKNVYTEVIKSFSNELRETITAPIHDKGIYEVSFTLDSNINQLKDFSGYTYGANIGVDPKQKSIQYGGFIIDPSGTENSFYNYLKDGNNYQRFSDYDKLVYVGKIDDSVSGDSLEESFDKFFEEISIFRSKISDEDADYLVNKMRDLVINSLDEDKLYKDDASITMGGTNYKVLAHHYNMNIDNQLRTKEYILNGILIDDKLIDILVKLSDVEKEDLINELEEEIKFTKEYEKTDDEIDYDIVIYTYGLKNEVIGYALNTKDNGSMHYYRKGNDIEIYLNNKIESLTTEEAVDTTFLAVGKTNGTVKVTVDNEELATLNIRSLDKKKIDFDYELVIEDDGKYTGTIKYVEDTNANRTKYEVEFSVSINGENIKIKGYLENDWTSEVANINTKASVNMTDAELEQRHNDFIKSLTDTPIGFLFKTTDGSYDPEVNNYYMNINTPDPICYSLDDMGDFESLDAVCHNYMCTLDEPEGTRTVYCEH